MVRVEGTVWTITYIEKIKDRLLTLGETQCSREEEKKPLRNLKDYTGYAAMSQVDMENENNLYTVKISLYTVVSKPDFARWEKLAQLSYLTYWVAEVSLEPAILILKSPFR